MRIHSAEGVVQDVHISICRHYQRSGCRLDPQLQQLPRDLRWCVHVPRLRTTIPRPGGFCCATALHTSSSSLSVGQPRQTALLHGTTCPMLRGPICHMKLTEQGQGHAGCGGPKTMVLQASITGFSQCLHLSSRLWPGPLGAAALLTG